MRTIQSIKVITTKWNKNVYVNFDNSTFGTWTKNLETKKITVAHLTTEELAEAKRLALVETKPGVSKWQDYRRPTTVHNVSVSNRPLRDVEGAADNAEITNAEATQINRNQPNEPEVYG